MNKVPDLNEEYRSKLIGRILAKVKVSETGCMLYTGAINSGGYACVKVMGKQFYAHLVYFTLMKGMIPEGMQHDHLCEVRHCINPDHIKQATPRENTLRSRTGITAINSKKTHCKRGHEFSLENTRLLKTGHRECKICRAMHSENIRRKAGMISREQWLAEHATHKEANAERRKIADRERQARRRVANPELYQQRMRKSYAKHGARWIAERAARRMAMKAAGAVSV